MFTTTSVVLFVLLTSVVTTCFVFAAVSAAHQRQQQQQQQAPFKLETASTRNKIVLEQAKSAEEWPVTIFKVEQDDNLSSKRWRAYVKSLPSSARRRRRQNSVQNKQEEEEDKSIGFVNAKLNDSGVFGRKSRTRHKRAAARSQKSSWQPSQTTTTSRQQQQVQVVPSHNSRGVKNVTAQNGQSILLHCLVDLNESGEFPLVSWFRGTDKLQLLTLESMRIIQDERFVVHHNIQSASLLAGHDSDWALQIKSLNASDAGLYQCQTSGDTSHIQSYQLNIVEPQVSILGSPDLAVKVSAPINLTCVIWPSTDELQFVFWYRDERMINYDLSNEGRGKIVMSKVGADKRGMSEHAISSNLLIHNARQSDSGNYTCMPSGARPTSIYVHVLEANDKRLIMFQSDEQPAAVSSRHETNGAVSVHVGASWTKLMGGRAYALLVALVILSTWFQLVAHVQTLISLLLVAIIGCLLSHTTERCRPSARDKLRAHHDAELLAQHATYSDTLERYQRQRQRHSSENDHDDDDHCCETPLTSAADQERCHLTDANNALELLKTIASEQQSDDDDCSAPLAPTRTASNGWPQTSPSSSSGTSSTGYQSDSTARVMLACASHKTVGLLSSVGCKEEEEEGRGDKLLVARSNQSIKCATTNSDHFVPPSSLVNERASNNSNASQELECERAIYSSPKLWQTKQKSSSTSHVCDDQL